MTTTIESSAAVEQFRKGVVGIYEDIPAAEYHRHGAISASVLKRAHCLSPLAAKASIDNPDLIGSESIEIGAAAHCLTLTPEDFDREFILAEQCEETIKSGENAGNRCPNDGVKYVGARIAGDGIGRSGRWLCGVHGKGKTCEYAGVSQVLKLEQHRRVKGIHDAVWADDTAREIMRAATDFELSILWKDDETGLLNKARLDILCREIGVIPDLKTCRSLKRFEADAFDMAYHIQLAHYLRGAMVVGLGVSIPSVIAIENEEPFDRAVFRPTQDFMDRGYDDMSKALKTIQTCHRTGVWPGRFASGKTHPLGLPEWAKAA